MTYEHHSSHAHAPSHYPDTNDATTHYYYDDNAMDMENNTWKAAANEELHALGVILNIWTKVDPATEDPFPAPTSRMLLGVMPCTWKIFRGRNSKRRTPNVIQECHDNDDKNKNNNHHITLEDHDETLNNVSAEHNSHNNTLNVLSKDKSRWSPRKKVANVWRKQQHHRMDASTNATTSTNGMNDDHTLVAANVATHSPSYSSKAATFVPTEVDCSEPIYRI